MRASENDRSMLLREAKADVNRDGFISSGVAVQLDLFGVDSAQLERDLLDKREQQASA